MARRYDILGQRVRSARKPIVARSAPSAIKRVEPKKGYGERVCIANCQSLQRDCRTDAVNEYRTATKECSDNRSDCITECKKPLFSAKEE